MRNKQVLGLAAALLLAGTAAASAAGTSTSTTSHMTNPSASTSGLANPTHDTLSLSSTQQKSAWKDLNAQASNQSAPSGFQPMIGAMVPGTIKTQPMPSKVATDIPSLKSYDFAKVDGKLLIVNPSDKKVAEVISSG
jgi:hypothetical protein